MTATNDPNRPTIDPTNAPQKSDWLEDFLSLTGNLVSPEIFRVWAGITVIAAAMERRLWTSNGGGVIYPNLFTTLVAPPGIGKSTIIDFCEGLMLDANKFRLAPKDVTRSSLIDALAKASQRHIHSTSTIVQYNSLFVTASELGVFLPAYDMGFLSLLNYIFDNPPSYTQERRSLQEAVNIINPQMTILAGTQPGFLASLLPEEAWSMGTTSRLLMIYSTTSPKIDLWAARVSLKEDPRYRALTQRLAAISRLYGEFTWDAGARRASTQWYTTGCEPVPQHSRLQHYVTRRLLYVFKLSMISSIMRGTDLIVTEADFIRGRDWLLWAEQLMPDIFRDMAGRSDNQVLQELHYHLWTIYAKQPKPIHESKLFAFLSTKVPSEKIQKIMEIAERANIVSRQAGHPYYIPLAKHLHGVE